MRARESESVAARKVEPAGTTTRTGAPYCSPQPSAPVASTASVAATRAVAWRRRGALRAASARAVEDMLEKEGSGERVDISLPAACRATHLAHGAQRGGGRVALVDE